MLQQQKIKASFFFTGDFYRNKQFSNAIKKLYNGKHYLGAHSDKHLLYCDWTKRDSLLLTQTQFTADITNNYFQLGAFDKNFMERKYFLPPYEWYNDTIASWAWQMGLQLVNYTSGTISHADYTTPEMKNYRSSDVIYQSILDAEQNRPSGLNGYLLLLHTGAGPKRADKFYTKLPQLIGYLKAKGYHFQRVDEMLGND